MKDEEWFKTKRVGKRTWAIDDRGADVMYLIAGDEKCLLVDTGWGIGDLPKTVSSLSSLPLLVLNTHGHPDHSYGNSVFEQVHIHEADKHLIHNLSTAKTRKWMIKNVLPKPLPKTPISGLNELKPRRRSSLTPGWLSESSFHTR